MKKRFSTDKLLEAIENKERYLIPYILKFNFFSKTICGHF